MKILRQNVIEEFNAMIQDVVEEIQQAEKKGDGLDITVLFGKQSGHYKNLNAFFDDAETRYTAKPKKFF